MSIATARSTTPSADETLPFSLPLELNVTDPEVIRELWRKTEGRERDEYALAALRLGTLALRQARGEIDAESIRREGERLMQQVRSALDEHRNHIDHRLSATLQDYFDPNNGRFNERIERLIKDGGELERLLAAQLTAEDSAMSRALSAHVGLESPLFKLLSPKESDGLLHCLRGSVEQCLEQQRTQILREFSLDNNDGALTKLVTQLRESNGQLTDGVQTKIDAILRQFSFDDDQSAISRMRQTVDRISGHFTLDNKDSALSRLKDELMGVLQRHAEGAQKFQEEVRVTLESMRVRRQEAARSTTHGHDFEAEVTEFALREALRQGDVPQETGRTTGLIKNCKKGDAVIELGPESAAPGVRIVIEAKEDHSYDVRRALQELDEARRNRGAEVGLFVFSSKSAPGGLDPLLRYGNDIVAIWDAEDPTSDMVFRAAISVAKALCTRGAAERANLEIDFDDVDKAILDIQKQVQFLEEIGSSADSIRKHSEKIHDRLRKSREAIDRQVQRLTDAIGDVKHHFSQLRQ